MSSTQYATTLREKQGSWELTEQPIPSPGHGEVLVKIYSIGLSRIDWQIQQHGSIINEYPAILGSDGAGEVEAVGEDVYQLRRGDHILFQGNILDPRGGTFQQYAVISADLLAKIPSFMSFDEAATIPMGLATATCGLYLPEKAGLVPFWEEDGKGRYARHSIVIMGGSSTVGQFVIQLARASGFSPIIATVPPSSGDSDDPADSTSFLRELGVTHILDSHKDARKEVRRTLEDGSAIVVYDAPGIDVEVRDMDEMRRKYLAGDILVANGTFVMILPEDHESKDHDAGENAPRPLVLVYSNPHVHLESGKKLYAVLPRLLEERVIKPIPFEVCPGGLSAISNGVDRLARGLARGKKVIIHPHGEN